MQQGLRLNLRLCVLHYLAVCFMQVCRTVGPIVRLLPAAGLRTVGPDASFMIGFSGVDLKGSVDLLQQYYPHQLVREGHR